MRNFKVTFRLGTQEYSGEIESSASDEISYKDMASDLIKEMKTKNNLPNFLPTDIMVKDQNGTIVLVAKDLR